MKVRLTTIEATRILAQAVFDKLHFGGELYDAKADAVVVDGKIVGIDVEFTIYRTAEQMQVV